MAKKREEMSKLVFDVTEQQLACRRDWTTLHSSKFDRATDLNYEKDLYSLNRSQSLNPSDFGWVRKGKNV